MTGKPQKHKPTSSYDAFAARIESGIMKGAQVFMANSVFGKEGSIVWRRLLSLSATPTWSHEEFQTALAIRLALPSGHVGGNGVSENQEAPGQIPMPTAVASLLVSNPSPPSPPFETSPDVMSSAILVLQGIDNDPHPMRVEAAIAFAESLILSANPSPAPVLSRKGRL